MATILTSFRSVSFFLMVASVLVFDFVATGGATTNHLLPGQTLKNGDHLEEDNYDLIMQPDCNLVLYEENPHNAIWSSQTDNKGNRCEATLKRDGNFVISDQNGTVIEETQTNNTDGNNIFLLQRDRNLVIYSKAVWSSQTNLDDEPADTTPNNHAIQVRGQGKLNALMLFGACICALLF